MKTKSPLICLSYAYEDYRKAKIIYQKLLNSGFQAWMDREDMLLGQRYKSSLVEAINDADFFIICLSKLSTTKGEIFQKEFNTATKLLKERFSDDIRLIPVRLEECDIPYQLQEFKCIDTFSDNGWIQLEKTIRKELGQLRLDRGPNRDNKNKASCHKPVSPIPIVGPVKTDCFFYIYRDEVANIQNQIKHYGSTTIIKGPKYIGKSSLLARIHDQVNINSQKVCYIHLKYASQSDLDNLDSLFLYIARIISQHTNALIKPDDFWDPSIGPKDNLQEFLETYILNNSELPTVIFLDDVDVLFDRPYRNDFFATIDGWHNLRATHEIWNYLNLIISYSTEPYLWIPNIEHPPFNIGMSIKLGDFNIDQIYEMNEKYKNPLKTEGEIQSLIDLIGGHPYLLNIAFYTMVTSNWSIYHLQYLTINKDNPFNSYLCRYRSYLSRNIVLLNSIEQILTEGLCENLSHSQRLKMAGIIQGEIAGSVRMSCKLYEQYFYKLLSS